VKVGVALPHYGRDVSLARVTEIAVECERLGFDSVWISDHLVFDLAKYGGTPEPIGSLEALSTLSVLAEATHRVRLGTLVLCNEFRHPALVAKQAAVIDRASGGRLELGIGAGWYEPEFAMFGFALPRPAVRLARLEEAIQVIRGLLSGRPFTFEGRHYRVTDAVALPAPEGPVPIWVGGKGDRTIGIAARLADGWNGAWFQEVDAYMERASKLGDADVLRSVAQYARGSAQEMTDRLAPFAELGVDHAIVSFSSVPFGLDDPDDIARFAQDVLPHVRG